LFFSCLFSLFYISFYLSLFLGVFPFPSTQEEEPLNEAKEDERLKDQAEEKAEGKFGLQQNYDLNFHSSFFLNSPY